MRGAARVVQRALRFLHAAPAHPLTAVANRRMGSAADPQRPGDATPVRRQRRAGYDRPGAAKPAFSAAPGNNPWIDSMLPISPVAS